MVMAVDISHIFSTAFKKQRLGNVKQRLGKKKRGRRERGVKE